MKGRLFSALGIAVAILTVALGYAHKGKTTQRQDESEVVRIGFAKTEEAICGAEKSTEPLATPVMIVQEITLSPVPERTLLPEMTASPELSDPHGSRVEAEVVSPEKAEMTATPRPTAETTAAPKPTAKATATPKPTAKATATPKPTAKGANTPKQTVTITAAPKPVVTPEPVTEKTNNDMAQDTGSRSGIIISEALPPDDEAAAEERLKEETDKTPEPEATSSPVPTPNRMPTFSVSGGYDWAALELAARVAYFEAGTAEGREAVLNVIYNRCRSKEFGGKVTSVETEVYRKSQFSVVRKEKFELTTAPDSLIHKADAIFNGGQTVLPDEIVFFRAEDRGTEWDGKEYYKTIGGNAFFKKAS